VRQKEPIKAAILVEQIKTKTLISVKINEMNIPKTNVDKT